MKRVKLIKQHLISLVVVLFGFASILASTQVEPLLDPRLYQGMSFELIVLDVRADQRSLSDIAEDYHNNPGRFRSLKCRVEHHASRGGVSFSTNAPLGTTNSVARIKGENLQPIATSSNVTCPIVNQIGDLHVFTSSPIALNTVLTATGSIIFNGDLFEISNNASEVKINSFDSNTGIFDADFRFVGTFSERAKKIILIQKGKIVRTGTAF